MRLAGLAACGVLTAGVLTLGAQEPAFRGGVELVALNVVVTDGHDKPVLGLNQDNFIVFEDGIRQDVSFFATSRVPLDLALLLDTSASMSDKMKTMQEAAVGFVSSLGAGDRVTVVDIKDTVKVLHALDDDIAAATAAIRSTGARGGTALYNGIYMTLKELAQQRGGAAERRQAIAVLSDGEDTASLVSLDDVMDVAKRAGVSVYAIALRSAIDVRDAKRDGASTAEYGMRALARETGARAFFPGEITELAGVYGTIAEELAAQYALGYTSTNQAHDGEYRRVQVQVADVTGVKVRTRAGYLSPESRRVARR
jgi:Ca-activated chloride channel family protein